MNQTSQTARAIQDQKARQRTIIVVFGAICLLVIGLRLKLLTRVNEDAIQPLYNQICEELQNNTAFSNDTWEEARRHVRRSAANPGVLFTFQYVSTVMGKTPLSAPMERVEAPIRARLQAGDFEGARDLIRRALVESDAMSAERAEVWGHFIREMERRWENRCLPVQRAVDELPTG